MRISDWSSDVCSSDLSVLQWAAPSVDQALFQRLLSQGGGEAGLASGDRASQAVIEGRATLSVVFVEKRSQSGRLPWHAAGDAGLTGSPAVPAPVPAIATVIAAPADWTPRSTAHGD